MDSEGFQMWSWAHTMSKGKKQQPSFISYGIINRNPHTETDTFICFSPNYNVVLKMVANRLVSSTSFRVVFEI